MTFFPELKIIGMVWVKIRFFFIFFFFNTLCYVTTRDNINDNITDSASIQYTILFCAGFSIFSFWPLCLDWEVIWKSHYWQQIWQTEMFYQKSSQWWGSLHNRDEQNIQLLMFFSTNCLLGKGLMKTFLSAAKYSFTFEKAKYVIEIITVYSMHACKMGC